MTKTTQGNQKQMNQEQLIQKMTISEEQSSLRRDYKDSVFIRIFSEPSKLIELYNAIFDTDYSQDTPVTIETIGDAIFRTLKNDIAFSIAGDFIVLVEQQSTINENMPLRDLIYSSTIYQRIVESAMLYRKSLVKIPRPQFIVLYNGKADAPAEYEMRLSDAFMGDGEISLQLVVKVYNINSEVNSRILKKCRTLYEYSEFVKIVREYREHGELTDEVMREILNRCISNNILADFLKKYGSEVIGMLFKELTEEEDREISKQDGIEEGIEIGIKQGLEQGIEQGLEQGIEQGIINVARSMKAEKISPEMISKVTGLTKEEIGEL